ncbi:MAG: hypothetical protein KDC75_25955, partial [Phaeodactylibacter sp.]|nr:hypothetical protein [Phaeodactylibacter sp.]
HRMKQGLPVVVHGDGTSIWTLTHHTDFAVGLVGLLGKTAAIGEAFHITSDEWLSWNQIYHIFARELNVEPHLVHVPSKIIAKYDQQTGDGLLGDKAHSMIFDNSRIKGLVPDFNPRIPFHKGVEEIVQWYGENTGPRTFEERIDQFMEEIIRTGCY